MGKGPENRGTRDTSCKRCLKLFHKDDVTENGICKWCEYDLAQEQEEQTDKLSIQRIH